MASNRVPTCSHMSDAANIRRPLWPLCNISDIPAPPRKITNNTTVCPKNIFPLMATIESAITGNMIRMAHTRRLNLIGKCCFMGDEIIDNTAASASGGPTNKLSIHLGVVLSPYEVVLVITSYEDKSKRLTGISGFTNRDHVANVPNSELELLRIGVSNSKKIPISWINRIALSDATTSATIVAKTSTPVARPRKYANV